MSDEADVLDAWLESIGANKEPTPQMRETARRYREMFPSKVDEIAKLRALLQEARAYVGCSCGYNEDSEADKALLARIDEALG